VVATTEVEIVRLIKRYANRKMYDTQSSKYITLEGVADLIRAGDDLRVIDNDSGEDLTAVTFAQIIFEEQKRDNPLIGVPVLRWIIQQGGATLHEIMTSVDRGREALGELAQRSMQQFSHATDRTNPAGRRLIEDLLEGPQKQLEQLQHRIDAQVRASIERVTGHPAVRQEIQRLEENIRTLENQLRKIRGLEARPPEKRKRKRGATKSGR
jgi:polyhydroxyalkanoate synthesis repressor PhaR